MAALFLNTARTIAVCLIAALTVACPRNAEDALMLHLYHMLHSEIAQAAKGTDLRPEYIAALISIESSPPGNRDSERFEPNVYRHLLKLKQDGTSWGGLDRKDVLKYSDDQLKELATSYGLVQIMGYHCIDLGCDVAELKGDYQLQWAAAYMQFHYAKQARQRDWNACFRIHNTGRPNGRPHRSDYVERGLIRMQYYREWMKKNGSVF
ncbi:MAG: hypothetical protein RIF32_00560 [Leptospirales bacterium]|jgi:hypothetical protein